MRGFDIAVMVLFSPSDGFIAIKKDRTAFRRLAPTLILLASLISSIARLFIVHYPLADVDVRDVNLFQGLFNFLMPFLLWVIAYYYVTCIFSGEILLREAYAAVCYAFLPYALFTLPVAAFTNVIGIGSAGLINTLTAAIMLWVGLLILVGIREMNNYSIPATIGVAFVGIIALLFIAVIMVLLYVLGAKLVGFAGEVFKEYRLLIFD